MTDHAHTFVLEPFDAAGVERGGESGALIDPAPHRRIGLVGRIAEGGGRHRGGLPDIKRPMHSESCSTNGNNSIRAAARGRSRTLGRTSMV